MNEELLKRLREDMQNPNVPVEVRRHCSQAISALSASEQRAEEMEVVAWRRLVKVPLNCSGPAVTEDRWVSCAQDSEGAQPLYAPLAKVGVQACRTEDREILATEAGRELLAKAADVLASTPTDTTRLNWIFSELHDEAIAEKIEKVSHEHTFGAAKGIRVGDFRAAIDAAMLRTSQGEKP